ncbi:sensor histidine kinase [Methylovirgula sp. 4M-Z18]|uniref:sensor histidine kinase n=1 Tax=Methylovirgula sp. 4M-Z18 TaxID=2293567 RepID=UPI000E2EBE91|nr:sensor histidine kinase KdpD [Methylovirgula sp. 4M-Z18]RFB80642.1 sensor histidine kinase KdpD [Methylovirgula sp. 4M-Z18]
MSKPERQNERRPDPDALLALAGKEKRGKLKVFLGAAPGVGKTYAMLQNAKRLKQDGIDVVIGLVETHGRTETAALIEGLEILPRRRVSYKDRIIEEFDIDGALARRPKLIVVDELAHTNAPESRHPKRWQDVEELLDAGIDVWTALNIQHLESLADVVSSVTSVAVRETVPDKVLQEAEDVVLVDITPAELIERLKEGKVYLPETARRASQNFFTPRNLTALRELALRRTADRVDDQMVDYLRQSAIEGPWRTSERLLACIGPDPLSELVVRTTSRLATSLNASWLVIHATRPGEEEGDSDRIKRIDDTLRLAERLGGETQRLTGRDLANEVLRFARRENITQIVLGRSGAGTFKRLMHRSLTDEIVRSATDVGIHIVCGENVKIPLRHRLLRWPMRSDLLSGVVAPVVSVALAVGVGEIISHWFKLPNLEMIFLTAVLFCAVRFGLWSAVASSLLSFLAYNFFFIPPIYTFTIAEPNELFALIIFLVVAIFTGSLAGRVRDQSETVYKRAQATQSLYEFSRKLSGTGNLDDVLWAAAAHMHKTLGGRIVLLIPKDGELQVSAAWPPTDELSAGEAVAARWAFDKGEAAGWLTGTLPNVRFQFRPLATSRGALAVCGVDPEDHTHPLSAEDERTLTSLLEQTAIAIDRSLLVGEAVKAAALEQNEALRSTLLSSLSHDLRTPLASITGAVTSLRQLGDKMPPNDRQDLLASIEEESGRLTRFVGNLLDMSRIESGAIKVKRDWVDVADVVRAAVERAQKIFPNWSVSVSIAPNLPFIRGDASLLAQVLFNLLDNARKYGGDTGASVHARAEDREVVVSVTDEGVGVKPGDLERIFEKFYRGGRADGRKAGTGLGLSIARGLTEAMGGTIAAQSPAVRRRGTRVLMRFPAAETPPDPEVAV